MVLSKARSTSSVPSAGITISNQSSSSPLPIVAGQLTKLCTTSASKSALARASGRPSLFSRRSSMHTVPPGSEQSRDWGTHCGEEAPSTDSKSPVEHSKSTGQLASQSVKHTKSEPEPIATQWSLAPPHCTSAVQGSQSSAPPAPPGFVTVIENAPVAGAWVRWSQLPSGSSSSSATIT